MSKNEKETILSPIAFGLYPLKETGGRLLRYYLIQYLIGLISVFKSKRGSQPNALLDPLESRLKRKIEP